MNLPSAEQPRHWSREPLVWMLIAIPLSAVVMGVVILSASIYSYTGLVVDDYYQKGKQINRVIARDRLAWELGLEAELRLAGEDQVDILLLHGFSGLPKDPIQLDLVHRTIPGRDRQLTFERSGGNRLTASVKDLGEGRWNVYLHTGDWRLTGSLQRPGQNRVSLLPNYRPAPP